MPDQKIAGTVANEVRNAAAQPADKSKFTKATGTTKTDLLVRALSRKRPPSLAHISSTLGWQPHTTRAAISRLRKSGAMIETLRSETGGVTTYRILSATNGEAVSGFDEAEKVKEGSDVKASAEACHETQPIAEAVSGELHSGAGQ